jgi:hypothetical protein
MHCHAASVQTRLIKKKSWALSAGLALLSFAGMAQAADFLPLAPGNNWTYMDAKTGATFKMEVAHTPYYINNRVYNVLKGYTPENRLVRVNEFGNVVYYDQEFEQEFMLTAFETGSGGWFEAYGRVCPGQGQAQEKRVTHDGPAGDWSALEVLYRTFGCADTGESSEQFAENIGMLRRVSTTIAGPRTYDLVEAKIGNQSISVGKAWQVHRVEQWRSGEWRLESEAAGRAGRSGRREGGVPFFAGIRSASVR